MKLLLQSLIPCRSRAAGVIPAVLGVWLGILVPAGGDVSLPKGDNENRERAPSPRAMAAEGLRGVPVKIVLRAVTGETRPVEFLIRSQPAEGTLSEPVPLPRDGVDDRAMVTYTADPEGTGDRDAFTFAARLAGGGPISSAVPVTISISDPQPDLETFKQLDFDDVMVGESLERKLLVKNRGTGALAENPQLAPPWYLADPAKVFEVPAGSEALLRVVYAPSKPGDDQHLLTIGGGSEEGGAQILLLGRGVAPFAASPPILRTVWDHESKTRRAMLTVFNNTGARKTLEVVADPRITVPQRIALGGKETVEVPVVVGGDNGPYEGALSFRWNSYTQKIRVIAASEPAVLEVVESEEGGEAIVFPATLAKSERLVPVKVKNLGGEAGDVLAEATTPFFVKQSDRSFVIQQHEERTILVGINSSVVGNFRGTLQVFCDGRETAIPLRGSIVNTLADVEGADAEIQASAAREDALDAARRKFGAENPNLLPRPGQAGLSGILEGDDLKLQTFLFERGISKHRVFSASVPPVTRWGLRERSTRSLTLGWFPPEKPGDYRYEVEYQRLLYVPKHKRMMKFWDTFPEQSVQAPDKDGIVSAKLSGLQPGAYNTFRVLVHQIGEGWSRPSNPLRFGTEAGARIPWRWLIIGLMSAGLVAIFVFKPSVE
ncbi:hypothetical protein BH23VER1_BH23VER1_19290 [soil metagenome]